MNEKSVIQVFVTRFLGTSIRHGLSVVAAWLLAKGFGELNDGSITNITTIIEGSIVAIVSFGLSYYKSHRNDEKVAVLKDIAGIPQSEPVPKASELPIGLFGGILFATFLSAASFGCQIVSHYDQNSYDSAIQLKADAVALMQHAIKDKAGIYSEDIAKLRSRLDSMVAYEAGKGKNNIISATQWDILTSTNHNLLGKFLNDWEHNVTFSPAYVTEKIKQVADGFDAIIKLEGAKER